MSNLAYEGFCPHCHNYWIFCDCVDSYGTIGEDLAKDEGKGEGTLADDMPVVIVKPNDPMTDDVGSPIPSTPGFTGTPGDPSVLSPDIPTSPDDPIVPTTLFGGREPARTPVIRPGVTPGKRKDIDDVLNDIDDIGKDLATAVDSFTKPSKKPRPNTGGNSDNTNLDNDGKLPGARLPGSMNSDIQHKVPPSDFDVPDILGFDIPNSGDKNDKVGNYDTSELHKKYQFNGEPEFVRRGPRPNVLREAGLPIFTGPMYSVNPTSLTPDDKNGTTYLSKEYTEFLEKVLEPWVDSLSPEDARIFDVDCYVSDGRDRVPEGKSSIGPYQIQTKTRGDTNTYFVSSPNGEIVIRTKMDLSVDFFDKIHPNDLPTLLNPPNQDGVQEFVVEYTNGSPLITTRAGYRLSTQRFVSGIQRISYDMPRIFYDEGGYDVDNEYPVLLDYIPPSPSYIYKKNTTINTRRLSGSGLITDIFRADYENFNSCTFMTNTHGKENQDDANSFRTTQDNWGDPSMEGSITFQGPTKGQKSIILKYVYEMINVSDDPSYAQSTFGLFKLKLNCNPFNIKYNVWIDKEDGSKIYPRIMSSGSPNALSNGIIKPEGDNSLVSFSNAGSNTDVYIYALIECPANDNYLNSEFTPNKFCAVNIQFHADGPTNNIRGFIREVSQLVKTNTTPQTYVPKVPNEIINTSELVGFGKIIPNSFESLDGLVQMSTQAYKNIWTRTLIWRRFNNQSNIFKYMVNALDIKTHDFPSYNVTTSPAIRQFYQFGTYINQNGFEDYTDSDFVLFNDNSTYPITSLSTDILSRATITLSFDNFIF